MTEQTDHEEDRTDDFFAFDEGGEDDEPRGSVLPKLAAAGMMLVATVLALVLLASGVRTFNEARLNEGYENRSWVMEGVYDDLTRDLQGDDNVAMYKGALPRVAELEGKTFVSDIADSVEVLPGDLVKFRGSQTGSVSSDFPKKVDALLVQVSDSELTVVRTGEAGTLVPVTEDTVSSQKRSAMVRLAAAILIFAAGVAGTFMVIRKKRQEENYEA